MFFYIFGFAFVPCFFVWFLISSCLFLVLVCRVVLDIFAFVLGLVCRVVLDIFVFVFGPCLSCGS